MKQHRYRFFPALCLLVLLLLFCSVSAETVQEEAAPTVAPVLNVTLNSHSKGENVLQLQQRLAELGYYSGDPDGKYGSQTQSAVRSFQRRNGLSADGIAGPLTLTALYSGDAVPVPEDAGPVDVLASPVPLLVNRDHPVDEFFVPDQLVLLTEMCDESLVRIKYPSTRAVRPAVEALIQMLEGARADGIVKWQISAAYRSYDDQVATLNSKIKYYLNKNSGWSRSRARKSALRTVQEPGCSEHHLGLAFDINVPGKSSFGGTKQCKWLHAHCWDYGFIVRYQAEKKSITGIDAEAWHIRYVGLSHALYMRDHDLCLEEYLQGIEDGTIDPPAETDLVEEISLD